MRLFARVLAAVALCCSVVTSLAAAQVQQAKPAVMDTSRLRAAEWDVVPIVRLDSSRTEDTMAVREIRGAHVLAPGRLVYQAKLAKGGKWAVFGVADGVTRRLVVSGQEFAGPDGRKTKINLDWPQTVHEPFMSFMAQVDSRFPNTILITDGAGWRRVVADRDTVKVAGTPMVLNGFRLIHIDDSGAAIMYASFKDSKLEGFFRIANNSADRVFAQGDSIAGLGQLQPLAQGMTGLPAGALNLRVFPSAWLAMVRIDETGHRYTDHLVLGDGKSLPRDLLRSETFDLRSQLEGIEKYELGPAQTLLVQRGQSIGYVDAAGWHALLGAAEVKPPKDGHFLMGDVVWVDDRAPRALVPVWLTQTHVSNSMNGVSVSTVWSTSPRLFYFDGTKATEVVADTSIKPDKVFWSQGPRSVARRAPGFDQILLVRPGNDFSRDTATYLLDPERKMLAPSPVFRTASGDVSVGHLLGWNNDREAVIRWNGLAYLRRK